MKVAKYILAVITLLLSVYAFIDKRILFGIMLLIIGALILPPISDKLKEKFSFWNNRIVRYVSLLILLMIGATNLPPARDTTIINYIQKETNDKALNELKKLESVGNDLGSSSAMANPKEFLNEKGKNTMVFDPKFDFSKATNYLKEDNENGVIQNLVVEFEFDSNNTITSKRTIITYSKKGEVTYPNNEIPAISTLIDYQAMETYKKTLAQEKERLAEEKRLAKQKEEQEKQLEKQRKEREERIEKFKDNCFSAWDGYHRDLVKYVKGLMNDPKSFEHVNTTYVMTNDGYAIINMVYRGRNALGGIVTESIKAKIDPLDCSIIQIIE